VFTDPPRPSERDISSAYKGVTDLARWRTRVAYRDLNGWWEALEERIVGRWPWLEDVADDEDDDEPLTMGMVYIGTRGSSGPMRAAGEQAIKAMSTRPDVSGPIRCGSWRSCARSTPRSRAVWARWAGRRAGASGSGSISAATASASGCRLGVRAATRTSLATCGSTPPGASGARRGRPRRHAVRARRGATCAIFDRLWHTTELSDLGLEVDIEPPTNLIDDSDLAPFPVVYEIAGELWRMKRAYDRRQPHPMPDNTDSVN
jgi:hypothetical protein